MISMTDRKEEDMKWYYEQPVKIFFGDHRINELENIIKKEQYKKGILVTSTHFIKNGFAGELLDQKKLKLSDIFSGFSPNPDVEEVDQLGRHLRKEKIDFIVAVGGGSVIDGAKAASVLIEEQTSITKYHHTGEKVPKKHLPLIAIPTTAGTGSEVTNVAVLTNRKRKIKAPIASESFYPQYAIVDPTLTYSMTSKLTASTGIDVLCHAIEGYWSRNHQPICDVMAVYAAKLVLKYLRIAYKDPNNQVAREKMAAASLIAGLAFGQPKTTASHACSFPLTNLYQIPHGEACGLTLDFFIRLNGTKDLRTRELASQLGFMDYQQFADMIEQLKRDLKLRTNLSDLHLNDETKKELIRLSHHPNLLNNPVEISDQDLEQLYDRLCG